MINEEVKLLFIIADRQITEKHLTSLEEDGVNFNHWIYAHGTARTNLLEVLGIGETEKIVFLGTVAKKNVQKVKDTIKRIDVEKKAKTLAFTVPISALGGMASYKILTGIDFKTDEKPKTIKRIKKIIAKPYKKQEGGKKDV